MNSLNSGSITIVLHLFTWSYSLKKKLWTDKTLNNYADQPHPIIWSTTYNLWQRLQVDTRQKLTKATQIQSNLEFASCQSTTPQTKMIIYLKPWRYKWTSRQISVLCKKRETKQKQIRIWNTKERILIFPLLESQNNKKGIISLKITIEQNKFSIHQTSSIWNWTTLG